MRLTCHCRSGTMWIIGLHLYDKRPPSLLRVGSRSRRLWESSPTPTERYERRPCFCRIRCTCRSSDVLLFAKNGFVVGVRSLKVTARNLNNAGCCYEYTIVSLPRIARRYTILCSLQNTHIRCSLNWKAGGRHAWREAGKERGRMGDGREQGGGGGREQGEGVKNR